MSFKNVRKAPERNKTKRPLPRLTYQYLNGTAFELRGLLIPDTERNWSGRGFKLNIQLHSIWKFFRLNNQCTMNFMQVSLAF